MFLNLWFRNEMYNQFYFEIIFKKFQVLQKYETYFPLHKLLIKKKEKWNPL